MQPTLRHKSTETALHWLILIACLAWLFYPGLVGSKVPAFRDAYHFYYPQAVWLDHCAQQGVYFPTWNPDEGLGVSVAGQPSAALFYPLRPLWWIPGLNVAQKFSLFIVAHLLIAAFGIRLAARTLGLSDRAAWLAAISYSLSCPVFFQHTNLIYLCSAAWIGFVLSAILTVLLATHLREHLTSCIVFSTAASFMLLAGDPQTAVNTFIVAGIILITFYAQACWSALKLRQSGRQEQEENPGSLKLAHALLGWLAAAAILFTTISFVQWLPAWRWARHSGRVPVNSTEQTSPTTATTTDLRPVTSLTPAMDTALHESSPPRHHRYDFSLSPWHLLTCIWPTAGGQYLPDNSRLFAVIRAEGRMWIPSLFFGCWPCMLVLLAIFKPSKRARPLIVIVVFALLASFGNYSIVWLVRELLSGLGITSLAQYLPKDHIGSLAWLLNMCIPGYSMFRYPAKWTVWFVAAASLLAAMQLDRMPAGLLVQAARRYRQSIQALSLTGLVVAGSLCIAAIAGYSLDAWLSHAAPDPWLGPPNTRAIARTLAIACLIPFLSLSLGSTESSKFKRFLPCLSLITLAELTQCASCWTNFLPVPPASLDSLPRISAGQPSLAQLDKSDRPFVWANRSRAELTRDRFVQSPQSFKIDQARYQQIWLQGKLGVLANVRSLNATQSIEPVELAQLRTWLSRHDRLLADQPVVDQVLRELGVTHRLLRTRFDYRPSLFEWQAVADPQPLCQLLISNQRQPLEPQTLDWHWHRPDQLDVRIADPQAAILLVRQTNDGGWLARSGHGKYLAIDEKSMFVEIPLSSEDTQVKLSRKWFW